MSVLSDAQIIALWILEGGGISSAADALARALSESSGNVTVTSSNPDGGTNVGLYQLDTKGVGAGYSVQQLQNPYVNTQITIAATKNGQDWSEWADNWTEFESQAASAVTSFQNSAQNNLTSYATSLTTNISTSGAGGTGPTPNVPSANNDPTGTAGGLINDAGTLLHDTAEGLNFLFDFFHPGQQWRVVMGVGGIGAGLGSLKLYTSSSDNSSTFPGAILLAGVSVMALYMAFRPWPTITEGSGSSATQVPIRVTPYAAGILSNKVPPPGPAPANETGLIEVGLGAFAGIWAASKAAGVASGLASLFSGGASIAKLLTSGAEDAE